MCLKIRVHTSVLSADIATKPLCVDIDRNRYGNLITVTLRVDAAASGCRMLLHLQAYCGNALATLLLEFVYATLTLDDLLWHLNLDYWLHGFETGRNVIGSRSSTKKWRMDEDGGIVRGVGERSRRGEEERGVGKKREGTKVSLFFIYMVGGEKKQGTGYLDLLM